MKGKITTHSGILFDVVNPREEDILIEDIAWSLGNKCRYNGHPNRFYSVAEHSILCLQLLFELMPFVGKQMALAVLLHDASEAYLGDMPSPLKHLFPEYMQLQSNLEQMIAKKYGYTEACGQLLIDHIDTLLLGGEACSLFDKPTGLEWAVLRFKQKGLTANWKEMGKLSPSHATECFMGAYRTILENLNV